MSLEATAAQSPTIVTRRVDRLEIAHLQSSQGERVYTNPDHDSTWPLRALYALRGSARVGLKDASLDLAEGDFAVVRNSDQLMVTTAPGTEVLIIRVPAATVGPHLKAMSQAHGRVWATGTGTASLVGHVLRVLASQPTEYVSGNPAQLAHHVVGLMALLCCDGAPVVDQYGREGLLRSAKEYVEANLSDVGLSPSAIAASQNVSTRTLHRLFEADGLTVRGWIRGRRLERSRVDLTDPTLAHVPVSSIGARWGLWDAAHFSRLFKAEHGMPPRSYRAQAMANRVVTAAA